MLQKCTVFQCKLNIKLTEKLKLNHSGKVYLPTRTVMCLFLLVRKYSRSWPMQLIPKSLNARVGPWNNSKTLRFPSKLAILTISGILNFPSALSTSSKNIWMSYKSLMSTSSNLKGVIKMCPYHKVKDENTPKEC